MSYRSWMIALAMATATASALAPNAQAATARLLTESDVNMGAGVEFEQRSYANVADLIADNETSRQFLPTNLVPSYSIADIAYDGAYRVLYESDKDADGGNELYLATFDSWADVLSDTLSSSGALPHNISPAYDVRGFTYDGVAYRLLGESHTSADGDLAILSYATFADLLAGRTNGVEQAVALGLTPGISVAGLGFDNGVYHLMLESDADAAGGSELSLISYATFADLLANTQASSRFLPQNIASGYSVKGFEFESAGVGPGTVPEPATWTMLLMGFGALGSLLRRRRTLAS